ncbi:MAG: FKBP-type peptidyl-prolyl cis-trans isomerase [Xanthobacteraceae bacterium]|jgi:peptidylprolyl isomerase
MLAIRAGLITISALALAIVGSTIMSDPSDAQSAKPVTTSSGLQIIDTKPGTGATPRKNQTVVVHYTGWLYVNGAKGKKFDSSVDRNEPFRFPVGAGRVIAGWDEGVGSMKVGGKRTLIIPPNLGYGAQGAGGAIPPNATLIFDVELIDVN